MFETQSYKKAQFSILDLTEIEFALMVRIAHLEVVAVDAKADDAVFVLLDRSRAALAKVRAAL